MKIVVIGTRGIPGIPGGVETHCEKLFSRLVVMGYDVTVVRRSSYITDDNRITEFKGVKVKDIYAPRKKRFEAIIHSFLGVIYAKRQKADILHIHAIGPALVTPFARMLGLKVVMTHHGADYNRQKWGRMAKFMLKTGERFAAKYANNIISISNVITDSLKEKYGRSENIRLIFNGVEKARVIESTNYIESLGLEKQKYILAIGRFVPEKGFDSLIRAYTKSNVRDKFKLVLAGDADHETEYSLGLKKLAKDNGVVLTGFITGDKLAEVLSHPALFVLPSFHEGLPIALLEGMSYDLNVIVSNIPANTQVNLPSDDFFDPYNEEELTRKIEEKLSVPVKKRMYNLSPYNWDTIALQVAAVYKTMG
ncbi:glycosyltransferase involved in cell wall biosynthesis [Dysgonomonas sp. PH5-45]|uniref:glycosyltransferase family 4 protein n=1 Tax=unclassified Dysgonomonas TaxID=2630389 RepID=UPI002472EF8C|nr:MULTISPECIES: glycosyltransferase family 4 protein [unclassified Dysgonomonas]MDH6354140.1 glycosyltransferase involved in cell wall biosynthesis [Dysgonomonas sp. PH5-45]MDH6387009.1 glycosyltransferase involved in cell wall biosynthesis [Dysgonomonas sp. PH5-37]